MTESKVRVRGLEDLVTILARQEEEEEEEDEEDHMDTGEVPATVAELLEGCSLPTPAQLAPAAPAIPTLSTGDAWLASRAASQEKEKVIMVQAAQESQSERNRI